jgi:hypothetical protein
MKNLNIVIRGIMVDIVCGEIPLSAYDKLLKYCEERNKNVEDVWYFKEEELINSIPQETIEYWWENLNYIQEYGLVWDKISKDISLCIDNREFIFNRDILTTNNYIEPRPKPREGYINVSGGCVDKGSLLYSLNKDTDFDINLLYIALTDFSQFGYNNLVISGIYYDGNHMEVKDLGSIGKYMLYINFHE